MLKKILALALAGAMVIGSMSLTAFGAAGDMRETYDPQIKVTGLEKDDVATFYQIIEWVGITDANKNDPKVVGGWQAVSPYDTVLTPALLKAILIDDPDTAAENDPRGITSEVAGQLAQKATGGSAVTVTGTEAVYTIPQDKQGTYMVIITPKDIETIYNPVFVSSDYFENNTSEHGVPVSSYADKAAAKKSKLTTVKTFENGEDITPDNGQTTAVGDIVTFTVKTQIPQYGKVYTNPVFNVHDELTDLELVSGSVKVEIEGGATLTDGTEYALTPGTSDYLIKFDSNWIKNRPAATPIVITYKAKVTSAALKNVNEEDNQVEVIYSHNPSDTTGKDFKAEKDTTQHYTFTLDAKGLGLTTQYSGGETGEFIKIGLDGEGKVVTASSWTSWISPSQTVQSTLAGAKFGLYSVKSDADAGNANYYTNDIFKGIVYSDGNGKLEIKGLDAGTYYLKELEAPSGFIKDPSTHTIKIEAEFENVDITEYYTPNADGTDVVWSATQTTGSKPFTYNTDVLKSYTVTVDGKTSEHVFENVATSTKVEWIKESAKELPSSIVNTKGVELPSTGGIGTTIFYAGGAVLVLLAGVLLVSKRRIA